MCCLAALFAAQHVSADVLDGSRAGDPYGSAIAVQQVQTQFGDNFSELNAAYGVATEGAFLKVILTGQVENNFNKLNIFIDSVAGGQNNIGPDTNNGGVNPPTDSLAENYSGIGTSGSGSGPGWTLCGPYSGSSAALVTAEEGPSAQFGPTTRATSPAHPVTRVTGVSAQNEASTGLFTKIRFPSGDTANDDPSES